MSILKPGEEIFYLPGLRGLKLAGQELPKDADEALLCRRAYWRRLKENASKKDLKWAEENIREQQREAGILDRVSLKDDSYLLLCDRTYLIYTNDTTYDNWKKIETFFEENGPEAIELETEEMEEYLEDIGPGSALYEQIEVLIPYYR